MTLNEYQNFQKGVAIYPKQNLPIYPALKLCGEAGEVSEKIGKALRDGVVEPDIWKKELAKELGDVLWYISAIADDLGFTLQEVAELNRIKLISRKERGVLGGSGDNR